MHDQLVSRALIRPRPLALALLCAVLALSACAAAGASPTQHATSSATGSRTTPSATSSAATPSTTASLTCTLNKRITGIDVIAATLSCNVSGAAVGETSFTLAYMATGPNGQARPVGPPCIGPLQHGVGTCSQTFSLIAPYGVKPGSVEGEALPDHRHLGPVTPKMVL